MKEALFLMLRDEPAWLSPVADSETAELGDVVEAMASPTVPVDADSELNTLILNAIYQDRNNHSLSFEGNCIELKRWISSVRGDFFDLPIIVVLRGLNMIAARANVPSKQSKHILQALPFIMEDIVADDIDTLHMATGQRDKDGSIEVLGCQKSLLTHLLQRLDAMALPVETVIADMSCLPTEVGTWNFFTDGRTLLSNIAGQSPMSIELDALPILLNALFTEDVELPDEIVVTVGTDFTSENLENWLKTRFMGHLAASNTKLTINHRAEQSFQFLCEEARPQLEKRAIVNLLQGEFRKSAKGRPSIIPWKSLLTASAACLCLFVGYNYVKSHQLDAATRQADSDARALYKTYFPDAGRVVDVKRQMKEKLRGVGAGGAQAQFLDMMVKVGAQLHDVNQGQPKPRLSPTRVTFDESQGDLKIDFMANGFADLDALKSKLEQQALVVEIARASQDGEKMKARMNIRSAG